MPFKILLSIALIYIGTLSSIGQNIELSGQVKAADGVVLEFVNIGIQNKDIGTVSDKNGLFFLNIPPSNQKDSITVSYVGYFNKTLSIEEMIKKSPETILLKLNPFQLDEVIINNSEKKELKLGTQSYSNWVVGYVKSKNDSNNDIQEFVKKIKIKKASQVLNVNINLFNIKQETAIFRVNFYNVKDGLPFQKINRSGILFDQPISEGWNQLDLTQYDLKFDTDFFVSIEYIPQSGGQEEPFNYRGKLFGKSIKRTASQGEWNITRGATISMYVTVIQ